jgi:hypothetical protein
VADEAGPPFADGLIGVGGAPARPLTAAGLAAVVADVPRSEFGEAALRRNLEDLPWLERTARTHHAVIEAVAKERTVVPMRLATVYRSDESAAQMLRERAADLREALARIAGRSEWGVKAYVAQPSGDPSPQESQQSQETQGSGGPGAAYLRRRRAQLAARSDARQEALTSAKTIYDELGRVAVAARIYPPQSPQLAGKAASMVLNAAYLVADDRAGDFTAAVTDLAARHRSVTLDLTGPWPPYSFAAPPEPEPSPKAGDVQ